MQIPLSCPDITDLERAADRDVLLSPNLALGPRLAEFERKIAAYHDRKHAIAVNSGTSALHLAMLALGVRPGDEVITTSFSFVASTNCILYVDGRPRFADIDPHTWNLDPARLERALGPRTVGVLPVHVFGQPYDMAAVRDFAKRHGLWIVEDACEAIGAYDRHAAAGKAGDISVLAFYPNKQLTTGEGGVLMTDDDRTAALCRSLRNQGRAESDAWLKHERLGFNYRMSDIAAALGLAQLGRIDELLAKRENAARMYRERLADVPWLTLQAEPEGTHRSWFVFVVKLGDDFGRADRDALMAGLREAGVGCSDYFAPIHLQTYVRELLKTDPGDLPVTEQVAARTVALPFFGDLKEWQVEKVCAELITRGEALLAAKKREARENSTR